MRAIAGANPNTCQHHYFDVCKKIARTISVYHTYCLVQWNEENKE